MIALGSRVFNADCKDPEEQGCLFLLALHWPPTFSPCWAQLMMAASPFRPALQVYILACIGKKMCDIISHHASIPSGVGKQDSSFRFPEDQTPTYFLLLRPTRV